MSTAHRWRRVMGRCAVVGAGLTTLTMTSVPPVAAQAKSRVLTPPEIAQRAQPAVELIETDVSGVLTYYKLNVNTDAIVTFAQNNQDIQSAGNAGNFGDVTRMMIAELTAHPASYMGKGDAVTAHDELVYDGSGFNITPDGYIVTNTHVAVVSKDDATQGFVDDTLGTAVDGLTKELTGQVDTITFGGHALAIPDDQKPAIKSLILKFIGDTAKVGDITTTVYAGGGPTLSRNLVHKGQVARVVASGEVFPGKDVAILKIEARNLPVLPLGDDAVLVTGDPVHALGYPGDATFDPTQIADTVTADSTMSDGTVSNRLQSSQANYRIVENTATINHGSSGGPLLNAQGQVIGLTTASDASTEQKNGVNGGKFFFAVPSSVINDLLTANHVVPGSSPDQALYNKAVDLMSQSHYSAALKELRRAQADGYNTPYLQLRLDAANKEVAAGRDKPIPGSKRGLVIGGIALAVVIVVVAVVVALALARRRRKAGGPAPATDGFGPPPPAWPSPAPAPPAPGWQAPQPAATLGPPAPAAPAAGPPTAAPTEPVWQRQPPAIPPAVPLAAPAQVRSNGPVEPAQWGATAEMALPPAPPAPPAATRVMPEVQPTIPGLAAVLPAGWYTDPSGRHQLRYWDAAAWTNNVSDNGVPSTDTA